MPEQGKADCKTEERKAYGENAIAPNPTARLQPGSRRASPNRPVIEPALQIVSNFRRALVPIRGFAFKAAIANDFQIAIQMRREAPHFRRAFFSGLLHHRESIVANEGSASRKQLEENCAEAVDIGCGGELGRRAIRLFGCDITGRTETR